MVKIYHRQVPSSTMNNISSYDFILNCCIETITMH